MADQTMRAVVYRTYGAPDVLHLEEVPKPDPKVGEVLVRVHAAALNALDWHMVRGKPYIARISMGLRSPKRSIPGVDMAGTIEAVGADVTDLSPGDEVYANKGRACAEYVCGPARVFVRKPTTLALDQAAAVPAAALTALQALRDHGGIRAGQSVLVNGAAGGVGTFTVQLAHAFGAEVTAVCSTHNVDMVRALGARHVIDYTREDFTRMGQQFDLVIDNAASRPLLAMRRVTAPGGTLVIVGASTGDWIGPMVRIVGAGQLARFGSRRMTGMLTQPNREDLLTLTELIEAGKLAPVIDRSYPLAQTADALRYLETMHARAKVIISMA
jgi:NADPH:quinone reductase-like Zn-dependent oxidoreductase